MKREKWRRSGSEKWEVSECEKEQKIMYSILCRDIIRITVIYTATMTIISTLFKSYYSIWSMLVFIWREPNFYSIASTPKNKAVCFSEKFNVFSYGIWLFGSLLSVVWIIFFVRMRFSPCIFHILNFRC